MGTWDRSIQCPRCSASMEAGFIIDEAYGKKVVSKWIAGEPQKTWWMGLKLGRGEQIEVATYRCRRCGYLESYA